jgi:hypothetical protein
VKGHNRREKRMYNMLGYASSIRTYTIEVNDLLQK